LNINIDNFNIDIYYLLFLVLILSILSWKFVEIPFRNKDKLSRKFIFISSFLTALFFIIFGHMISKIDFLREEAMAKELASSSAIFSSNINERIFIKNRILYENMKPEAVVIGSSRVGQVSSKGTGLDLINLSVSGASVEDLIAIWELSSYKFNPYYVFLGADPWIFNQKSRQNRWVSLRLEYFKGMSKIGLYNEIISSENNNISDPNIQIIKFYNLVNQSKIKAKDELPALFDKILKDGSYVYNLTHADMSVEAVERGASSYISYAMTDFSYSSYARTILERLVKEIKTQNRQVVFVLSPYHPIVYDLMHKRDTKFMEIEGIFKEIAELNGVVVIGSYDPIKAGCHTDEFYDGMHPKDKCMNKIFSQLKK
jgi:hypothetical protein